MTTGLCVNQHILGVKLHQSLTLMSFPTFGMTGCRSSILAELWACRIVGSQGYVDVFGTPAFVEFRGSWTTEKSFRAIWWCEIPQTRPSENLSSTLRNTSESLCGSIRLPVCTFPALQPLIPSVHVLFRPQLVSLCLCLAALVLFTFAEASLLTAEPILWPLCPLSRVSLKDILVRAFWIF